ncbi:MAG: RluA family pseudouridine synthase [Betaproteobacteria bacterium]|nr:RluA family pseudouridine synthase [Betaproteobacteria bacterium]
MNSLSKDSATWREVDESSQDQRIDNYLQKILKGVPKSHIYRILRSGEVRVNSRRVQASYRLQDGDKVRLPPIRTGVKPARAGAVASGALFSDAVLLEDEDLLVIDKPSGVAVHGGSGISSGVIEQLRAARPGLRFLELVHRLDRDTSGVLILAKKRTALTGLHAQLRDGVVRKHYLALVFGEWKDAKRNVKAALHKYVSSSGERRVVVDEEGQQAHTVFRLVRNFSGYSLLDAELKTGRTHQIRVHLAHIGYPIAGDDKYGDFDANKRLVKLGLKRMFLHAASLEFSHPRSAQRVRVEAPLAPDLERFLQSVRGAVGAKDA